MTARGPGAVRHQRIASSPSDWLLPLGAAQLKVSYCRERTPDFAERGCLLHAEPDFHRRV